MPMPTNRLSIPAARPGQMQALPGRDQRGCGLIGTPPNKPMLPAGPKRPAADGQRRQALRCGETMRSSALLLFVSIVLAGLSGCNESTAPLCTDEWVYGLRVQVRDAFTGEPAASGSLIIATDGSYADTLRVVDDLLALGAGERAGIYSLAISKLGYQPLQMHNIRVTRGPCHVTPVVVVPYLVPE